MYLNECKMNKLGNYLVASLVIITLILCFLSQIQGIGKTNREFKLPVSESENAKIQSGDIILREGKSFISQAFRNFSNVDKHYSHAGVAYILHGKMYVCHVVAAEGNKSDKIRLEPLESFCNPVENSSWAVYRTDIKKEQIDQALLHYFNTKISFDLNFDLKSDDKMYCTELVYKIMTTANHNKKFINLSHGNGMDYVACDNLYLNTKTHLILLHAN